MLSLSRLLNYDTNFLSELLGNAQMASFEVEKARGNALFSSGDFGGAVEAYTSGMRLAFQIATLERASANGSALNVASAAKELCGTAPVDPEVVQAACSGLASDVRVGVLACVGNRSQAFMKLGKTKEAIRDCSVALAIDGGNVKALYRRAVCFESTGKIREALTDASRALQVDKSNAAAADLLRRLRAAAQAPVVAGAAEGGAATLADMLEVLKTASKDQGPIDMDRIVRNLQVLLVSAGSVRAFLGESGPGLLLSAAARSSSGTTAAVAADASASSSTTHSSITPAINLLIGTCGRISDEYCGSWHREWDADRSKQSLSLIDVLQAQARVVDGLATPVQEHITYVANLTSSGSGGAASSSSTTAGTAAAIRLGASMLAAAWIVIKPQIQAQTLHRLRQWKEIKEGRLATAAPLPSSMRSGIKTWGELLADVLHSIGPVSNGTSPSFSLVQLCLQATGHLCECEDAVTLLDKCGAIAAAAVHCSSQHADLRKVASGVVGRALSILQNAHPRGHAETGRAKSKALLTRIIGPCVQSLAEALPMKPDENKDASGASGDKKKQQQLDKKNGAADDDSNVVVAGADGTIDLTAASATAASEPAPVPAVVINPASLPIPDWSPSDHSARTTSLLHLSLLVDRDTGLWLADQSGVLPSVFIAAQSPELHVQQAACDVVAALCNDEVGRSLLTTFPQRVVSRDPSTSTRLDVLSMLQRQAESSSQAIRSGAAVTLAKLTAPSKQFTTAEGRQGADEMITNVLSLVKLAAGEAEEDDINDDDDTGGSNGKQRQHASDGAVITNRKQGKKPQQRPSFKQLVHSVKASWGAGASREGISALMGGSGPSNSTNTSGSTASSTSSSAAAANAGTSEVECAVDLDGASRAIEAMAVLATHTMSKRRLVQEDCVGPLLKIGASLCAHMELQRAVLISGDATNSASSSLSRSGSGGGIAGHVVSGKHGIIDLDKVSSQAKSDSVRGQLRPSVYGLAHIVYSLVSSRQRQQEARLSELEIDMDQWRELQRLATPPGTDPEANTEHDPPSDVEARTKELLKYDVLHLIGGLAEAAKGFDTSTSADGAGGSDGRDGGSERSRKRAGGSVPLTQHPDDGRPLPPPIANTAKHGAATRELLSLTLLQISEWTWARGLLVQGGGIPLLLELSREGEANRLPGGGAVPAAQAAQGSVAPINTLQGCMAASQALARVFITTNPALIPQAYTHDAIGPLLRLAREGQTSLSQFESGLALTNIGSTGEEARSAMLSRRALGALEYLQFSNHKLVRRAGTEAITNLATTAAGCRLITQSRLGLWLALARSFQRPGARIADGSETKKKKKVAAAAAGDDSNGSNASAASAPLNANEEDDDEDDDEERDTPTSMAAAGALAMACMTLMSDPSSEEEEKAAVECAERLVKGGAVLAMAELLLSGHIGLVHRGVTVLELLSRHAIGAAALLTPLASMSGDPQPDDSTTTSSSDNDSAFASASGNLHTFLLLHLLSQGRDLAAMAGVLTNSGPESGAAAAATTASANSKAGAAKGQGKHASAAAAAGGTGQIPPAIAAIARHAVRQTLQHKQQAADEAARDYNKQMPAAPLPAKAPAAEPAAPATDAAAEPAATPAAAAQASPAPVPVEAEAEEDSTWRLARLAPVWPSADLAAKILSSGDEDDD